MGRPGICRKRPPIQLPAVALAGQMHDQPIQNGETLRGLPHFANGRRGLRFCCGAISTEESGSFS